VTNVVLYIFKERSLFKHILVAFTIMAAAAANGAEEITFTNLYGPGGGSDKIVTSLIPSLEAQGFTVKKNFVKSCADAYGLMRSKPENHFLVIATGDAAVNNTDANGTRCPALATLSKSVGVYSALGSSPMFMCAAPGFEGTSVEALRKLAGTGKRVVFGIGTDALKVLIDKTMKSQAPGVDYVVVMYKSGAEITAAAKSRDIDYVVGATVAVNIEKMGGKCIAVSDKANTSLPFMGAFSADTQDKTFKAYIQHLTLLSDNSAVTPSVDAAMINAAKTPEFKQVVKANGYNHNGIGDGIDAKTTAGEMSTVEQSYIFAK
jgi:hypothetical protein